MLEILAPAGNKESAYAAIKNGADAIYLGLASSFSARQGADNFSKEDFREIILYAHLCGVKVYVAMNTLVKDSEVDWFFQDLSFAYNEGADAFILQDILLGKKIRRQYPQIPLHLSTQAGICTVEGAKLAKECGFERVILARETPLSEIRKIAMIIETEAFVQGALCTCFSGQCYFSSFAGGNSGNRGRCKQPCRKKYAYDRNGNTEKNFALSLSDLSVGEDIEKLIQAGVTSFKIEGRMRRVEYVAAAVRYYRGIFDEEQDICRRLSDLKRTYNRGNYTHGLAFGQDKRFLSTAIQGHLGEKVGVVKVQNGEFFIESSFRPQKGDSFKILRDGAELGGATYFHSEGKGFTITSKHRLRNGDSVFVTTDNEVNVRMLQADRKGELHLRVIFEEGKRPCAIWKDLSVYGEKELQTAQNRPLDEQEIRSCFLKTDGLPVNVYLEAIDIRGNIFIPKSELNAFRRKVFAAIYQQIASMGREAIELQIPLEQITSTPRVSIQKTAVISDDFSLITPNIAIYKPANYADFLPESFINGNFEKYIYYPSFATEKDLEKITEIMDRYALDGIYAENYSGILFAKEHAIKLFVGTGFNLTNSLSLQELLNSYAPTYYALSKELNENELGNLLTEKAFVLSSGSVKIMDLCYCPFDKTCAVCDKKSCYTLTDENERVFPVRRYLDAVGACRFEIYNCAMLIGTGNSTAGQLLDLTVVKDKISAYNAKDNVEKQKKVYKTYTSGHYKRGVL